MAGEAVFKIHLSQGFIGIFMLSKAFLPARKRNYLNLVTYMTKLLKGLELRKRIDGINFTTIKSFPELDDMEDEENKKIFKAYNLSQVLSNIGRVIPFDGRPIEFIKTKAIIDLNQRFGTYIEVYFKGVDLYVLIQFKGAFFIRDDAFEFCRGLVVKLSSQLDSLFRMTLIDVAQDFLVSVSDILPDPMLANERINYCFKYKARTFTEGSKQKKLHTGFFISSGRFKITVYDKKEENQKARNKTKKKYYEKLYSGFRNQPVTRVELRIKQESCKRLISKFFDPSISEEKFLRIALFQLYRKHKLRVQPTGSKDKDVRRWNIHENWKYIFCQIEEHEADMDTCPDFLYTTPAKDLDQTIARLVDTLANNYPDITEGELEEKLMALPYAEIIKKTKERISKKEYSDFKLDEMKSRVISQFYSQSIGASENVGIFITSPLERSENKESIT